MKLHHNLNQPFQVRMDFGLGSPAKKYYLKRICKIKDWTPSPSNLHRAELILDNLLILEKQNPDLCILNDFDLLWALQYRAGRDN